MKILYLLFLFISFPAFAGGINNPGGGSGSVSIGGAVTGGTANSILYIGSNGALAQDNANFNWNDSTTSMSIGGTSSSAFSVGANGATNPVFNVDSSVASQVSGITIQGKASGTAPTITTTDTIANNGLIVQSKGIGSLALSGGNVYIQYTGSSRITQNNYTTTFTPAASNTVAHFVYTSPVDGAITAGTALDNVFWNFGITRTWAGGTTIPLQKEFHVAQPTYAASSATTFTETSTVAIDGAPAQGTNATLSQTEALRVIGGAVSSATLAYGIYDTQPTGATSNYALGVSGIISITGSSPTVSSCGSGAITTGSSTHKGSITGITAATACTITFAAAQPLSAPAVCTFSDSAASAVGVSAISTTAVTASMASLTGTLYYLCF